VTFARKPLFARPRTAKGGPVFGGGKGMCTVDSTGVTWILFRMLVMWWACTFFKEVGHHKVR